MQVVSVRCPVCGSELEVAGEGIVTCPSCGAPLEVRLTEGLPPWLPTVLSAFGGALLGSFITGSWPLPTDPPEVRYDKLSKLVGSFVASGFVGFIAYELSRGGEEA